MELYQIKVTHWTFDHRSKGDNFYLKIGQNRGPVDLRKVTGRPLNWDRKQVSVTQKSVDRHRWIGRPTHVPVDRFIWSSRPLGIFLNIDTSVVYL